MYLALYKRKEKRYGTERVLGIFYGDENYGIYGGFGLPIITKYGLPWKKNLENLIEGKVEVRDKCKGFFWEVYRVYGNQIPNNFPEEYKEEAEKIVKEFLKRYKR